VGKGKKKGVSKDVRVFLGKNGPKLSQYEGKKFNVVT
jgi:hypothetical protein